MERGKDFSKLYYQKEHLMVSGPHLNYHVEHIQNCSPKERREPIKRSYGVVTP